MDIDGQPATDSKTQSPKSSVIYDINSNEIHYPDLHQALMSIAPDDDDIELTPIKSTLADKLATTEDNISKMLEAYENASRYVKYLQARQRMVICLSVAERKLSARDAELLIYLLLGETVARKSESPPSPFGAALQGAYEEGFDD